MVSGTDELLRKLKETSADNAAEIAASHISPGRDDFKCPTSEELDGLANHDDYKLGKHVKRVGVGFVYIFGAGLAFGLIAIFVHSYFYLNELAQDTNKFGEFISTIMEWLGVALSSLYGKHFVETRFGARNK